ncbi:unnamed protein product [Arctogadus glacialis]
MQIITSGHQGSVLLLFTIATIMYHSVDCWPAVSSSQPRTLLAPRNGFKNDWPVLLSSPSSTTTPSNRTYQSQTKDPGGSRFPRDLPVASGMFRRRTVSNFAPLHHSPPANRVSLGPNPQTSEQTSVYSAEKRGDFSDERCTPLKLHRSPTDQTETNDGGYQSLSNVSSPPGSFQLKEQGLAAGSDQEQSWLRQDPLVECGPEAMRLRIRRRRAGQLLLDLGNGSGLALSQLTAECGFSLQTTGRDLALTARYHGCHVALEGQSYVLRLLWRGVPVKMSCPAPRSSHCCSAHGMTVILHGLPASAKLHVKVREVWTPVTELALKCGYTLHLQAQALLVKVPFVACGVRKEDGIYSLSLQVGDQDVTLTCPDSQEESPRPPPWAPPFYLAPPYYPLPAYSSSPPVFRSYDTFQPTPQPSVTIRPPAWIRRSASSEPQPVDQNPTSVQRFPNTIGYTGTHDPTPPLFTQEGPGEWADHNQRPDPLTYTHTEDPPPPSLPAGEAGLQPPSSSDQFYHFYHLPKLPSPSPRHNSGTKNVTERRRPDTGGGREDDDGGGVEGSDAGADHPPPPHVFPGPIAPIGYFEFLQKMFELAASKLGYIDQDSSRREARNYSNPAYPIPEPPSHRYQYQQQPDQAPVATTSSQALSLTRGTGTTMGPPPSIPHYPLQHTNVYNDLFLRREVPHNPSRHEEVGSLKEAQDGAETVSTACQQCVKSENSEQRKEDVNQEHASVTPLTPPILPPVYPYFHYPPHQPMYPFFGHLPFQPTWRTKQHVPSSTSTPPPPPRTSTMTTTPATSPNPTATPSPDFLGDPLQNVYYHPYYFYHNLYGGQQPSDPSSPNGDHQGSPEVSPEQPFQTSASPTKLDQPGDPDPDRHQYSDADDPSFEDMQLIPHAEDQQASSTIIESTSDADDFPPYHYYRYYQPTEPLGGGSSGRETSVPDGQVDLDSAAEDGTVGMDQYQSMSNLGALSPDNAAQQDWFSPFQPLDMKPQGWQDCAVGQHLVFRVPHCVKGPEVFSDGESSVSSKASCTPQRLPWNPQLYAVPLQGCGVRTQIEGEDTVYQLELQAIISLTGDQAPLQGIPVRLTVECRSSADGSDSVTLEVVNPTLVRPVRTTEPPLVIQTKIATDASFTEFLPELHRPLSSLQGRPLHLEVRALGTGSRLLVHYCLAYIQTPHPAWMLLYHGCWRQTPLGLSQPTLSALRITVPHFLASPPSSQPPSHGPSDTKDTEVFFLCYSQTREVRSLPPHTDH